jgi:hypothetical protein
MSGDIGVCGDQAGASVPLSIMPMGEGYEIVPKIKRWFPVSHGFNRDPEIRELRRRFGDWMPYVWLELCAIGDLNDGVVNGTPQQIQESLAYISMRKYSRSAEKSIQIALRFMQDLGWIRIDLNSIQILNHLKYHRTENGQMFPPNQPHQPNHIKIPNGPVDNSKNGDQKDPDPWLPVWMEAARFLPGWPQVKNFVGRARKEGFGPEDVLQALTRLNEKLEDIPELDKWAYGWGTLQGVYPERKQAESGAYKLGDAMPILVKIAQGDK